MRYFYSSIFSVIPLIIYLLIVKSINKNGSKSLRLIFISYLSGALGALILVMITGIILSERFFNININPNNIQLVIALLFAPVTEEITKGLMLIFVLRNKNIYSPTNGLIYGGAIGLGFGLIENILYFITSEIMGQPWFLFVINRSFFLSGMHFITTSVFGALFILSKFKEKPLKFYLPIAGIMGSIIIHFVWNYITVRNGITIMPGYLFLTLSVVIFILLFLTLNQIEKKLIYREISEETRNNLI